MRTLITIFVLLLTLTGTALAEESLGAAAKRYGYSPELVTQLEAVFGEAKAAGLSVEPLRTKAVEGMAKRVPADRLVNAVRMQKSRMSALRTAAPAVAKSAAVERAGLTALAGGLSPETVAAVTSRTNDESRVQAALYAAGLLKTAGVDEASAAKFVAMQLEAGLRAVEIDEVSRASARASRTGLVTAGDLARMQPADLKGERRTQFLDSVRGFDGRRNENNERVRSPRAIAGDRAAETDRIQRDRTATEKRITEKPGTPIVEPPGDDDGHDDDDHEDKPEFEDDRHK